MRLTSCLTTSQKVAIKKVIYPLCRIVTGNKKVNTQYKFVEFGKRGCHTYFGYYDVSPFQGENIIYLEREKNSNVCKVVLNNINNTGKQYIGDSRAWNWQQGIRLRWFPKSKNIVSFNDYVGGKYINRILNIETKEERQIDWPLYDIDTNGKYGITLDFSRLGAMRPGYGYVCEEYKMGDLWNDGISIIDLENNRWVKTITYKELSENIKKIDDVSHFYINHLAFSPDGTKFLFFWIDEMNGYHQASLGVYDMREDKIIRLDAEKKASHYVWDGNDEIVCTLLDNIHYARYYRFNIKNRTKKMICSESLKYDGHPSIYAKGKLLTDTYPDTRGFQHIYIVDEENDEKREVVKIYSVPTTNVEKRTDLHPRLSEDKRLLAFDSSHGSLRKLMLLFLD